MVDLVIIGAGPGGYETALLAAKHNFKVVLIEKNEVGGTCLQAGCIPTKTLYRNAEVLELVKESHQFGITHENIQFDYAAVKKRKDEVISELTTGIKYSLEKANVELIYGEGYILDPHHVYVGKRKIETKYILIATGSKEYRLPISGIDLPNVLTSKELLDIDHVPKRLTIIGAGYIGCEFASIFSAFGSKVTLVEYMDSIVPLLDTEVSKRLHALMKRSGITIHTKTKVLGIEQSDESLVVKAVCKDKELLLPSDTVLLATGRQSVLDMESLNEANILHDYKKILVNEHFQTNIESIYAIGDVVGGKMLAHVASFQGQVALAHMLGQKRDIDFNFVPSAMFTFPEVASIGYTEEEVITKNIPYHVCKYLFRANGKAMALKETDGFAKLIVNHQEQIIGAHIIGPHASDLIHEIGALMKLGVGVKAYLDLIHAHPTLSEVVQEAIRTLE
ncbi:MAG TPA: dihydrolipoyl dehydrogenase [Bacilli bacterium]|nr:dihydrolipoyl dehydrogenase [Bacilli bacterium]